MPRPWPPSGRIADAPLESPGPPVPRLLRIQQVLLADLQEGLKLRLPRLLQFRPADAALKCLKRRLVAQQSVVVLNLPRPRVESPKRRRHRDPRFDWPERRPVIDNDLDAAAALALVHAV